MNKQILLGMLKSKTINTNVALTILITSIAASYGIPLTPEASTAIVALVYGGANVILRFFTDKSLPDKGVNIPNPVYVKNFTKAMTQDEEVIEQIHSAMKEYIKKKKQKGGSN